MEWRTRRPLRITEPAPRMSSSGFSRTPIPSPTHRIKSEQNKEIRAKASLNQKLLDQASTSVFSTFSGLVCGLSHCLTLSDNISAHNQNLQHPDLPLVNCGSRNHPMYVPAEVYVVTQGHPSRSKLDSDQTQQIIRHTVRKPWINAASITAEGIPTAGLDKSFNMLLVRTILQLGDDILTWFSTLLTLA